MTASALHSVAVVVLSWNGRDDTLRCLESLRAADDGQALTVVAVDNGSVDGSADAIAERFPEVVLVRSERNLGFSGGVNAGAAAAFERGADAVLLLNNDMVVEPSFVRPLAEASAASDVGAVCSQILFADPPERVWYAGARFDPLRGHQGRNLGFGLPRLDPSVPPYTVDCACGGAMLVPRRAWETVGPLDEGLFAYREDLDWSLRARAAGLRLLVAPASVVWHRVSGSSGGASSPTSLYYDTRNLLVVVTRRAPLTGLAALRRSTGIVVAHVVQALLSPRRLAGLRAVLEGALDARRGRLGERPRPRPMP